MKRKKVSYIFCVTVIAVFSFALLISCTTGSSPAPPGGIPAIVTLIDTGMNGATMLYKGSGSSGQTLIYIGHNSYKGLGGLKYFDTGDWDLKETGVKVDVGDFAFYDSDKIYIMGPGNTYYVEATGDPSGWSPEEIKLPTLTDPTSFGGGDMIIANDGVSDKVFIINPGSYPYGSDNTLYIIDTDDNTASEVNLGNAAEGFTKIGFYNNELYYTDSLDGDIYKSTDLNNPANTVNYLTTTNDGSTGGIFFNNSMAYVLVGLGAVNMGVHMFDPANPGASTTHFLDSGDLSAQYMVFEDNNTAYVTHYSGGVYQFDPTDEDSEFTIISGTDPVGDTGMQDIVLDSDSNILYTAVNNFPNASKLMKIEFY